MILFGVLLLAQVTQAPPAAGPGRITPAGVARAQAVVDSVFLDRKVSEGVIEGGDWASYLMVRLGVHPLPDSVGLAVTVDSTLITFSGRIADLPPEARGMLGPLAALVDPNTVLSADVEQLKGSKGIAHFWLRGVSVGGLPVPEMVVRSMMMNIGDNYPALTKSGRDLFVEIPDDGQIKMEKGGVRLRIVPQ